MGQTFPYFSTKKKTAPSVAPVGDDDPCYFEKSYSPQVMARFEANVQSKMIPRDSII